MAASGADQPAVMTLTELWNNGSPADFQACLNDYSAAIKDLTSTSQRLVQADLPGLDRWYREELPAVLRQRAEEEEEAGAYVTAEEHIKLVQWKMTRNKFRPGHSKYASALADDDVRRCTRAALRALAGASSSSSRGSSRSTEGRGEPVTERAVQKAVEEASKLKGVGPATSTMLLAAADPTVPFMSEEALEAVQPGQPKKYTMGEYLAIVRALRAKAAALTASVGGSGKGGEAGESDAGEGGGSRVWNAVDVEHALWAAATREKLGKSGKKAAAAGGSKSKQPAAKRRKK